MSISNLKVQRLVPIIPTTDIKVKPKESPVINGIGINGFFDIRLRILLKIAAGSVMRTSIEIDKCQR